MRDRFTGVIQSYPAPTKNTDDVVLAIKKFMRRRIIREAHSDKARQFVKAMGILKIPFDHALPGKLSKNFLAERNNQLILATATTCLLEAALGVNFMVRSSRARRSRSERSSTSNRVLPGREISLTSSTPRASLESFLDTRSQPVSNGLDSTRCGQLPT